MLTVALSPGFTFLKNLTLIAITGYLVLNLAYYRVIQDLPLSSYPQKVKTDRQDQDRENQDPQRVPKWYTNILKFELKRS